MKHAVLINNSHIENFSVRNIGSYLKSKGFKVSTVHYEGKKDDVFNLLPQQSLQTLADYCKECDLVGLTLLTTHLLSRSIQITRFLKKRIKAKIIWGGVPVICDPEYYLQFADYVCAGEGELLMAQLLEGKPFKEIKGLGYTLDSGKPVINPLPDIIDINQMPIPHIDLNDGYILDNVSLTPMKNSIPRSLTTYSVLSVRGCPHNCSYCLNSKLMNVFIKKGKYIRKIDSPRVIKELEWAKKNIPHLKRIIIDDDDFFLRSEKEMKELLDLYMDKINLPVFYLQAHIKHITREKLRILKESRIQLRYLKIGLQSASIRISRDIFNRPLNKEIFLTKLDFLIADNVRIMIDVISDNPYETPADKYEALLFYHEIIKIVMKYPVVDLPIKMYDHKLMYYPGSKLFDRVIKDRHIPQNYVDEVLLKRNTLRKHEEDIDNDAFIVALFNIVMQKKKYYKFAWIFLKLMRIKPFFYFMVRFNIVKRFSFLRSIPFIKRVLYKMNFI